MIYGSFSYFATRISITFCNGASSFFEINFLMIFFNCFKVSLASAVQPKNHKSFLKFLNKENKMLEASIQMRLFFESSDIFDVANIDVSINSKQSTKYFDTNVTKMGRKLGLVPCRKYSFIL